MIGKFLAAGRTADIYEWETGYVLKLFHTWMPVEDIEYEFRMAQAVHSSGLAPLVKPMIEHDGRTGLIYERVAGHSMFEIFKGSIWKIYGLAQRMADMHFQLHRSHIESTLPPLKLKLERKLQNASALPTSLQKRLIEKLADFPDGDRICHGDFHPGNIMLDGADGKIIDWIDASRGNPLADVARTSILLLGAVSTFPNPFLRMTISWFHAVYLKRYFSLHKSGEAEYQLWLPIVAGARLSEGISELEPWLLEQAQKI
jgi:Ser/Thr protein kinase RdoA (MazF antagonist)